MTFHEFEKKYTDGIRSKPKKPIGMRYASPVPPVMERASWKLEELRASEEKRDQPDEGVIITEERGSPEGSAEEQASEPQWADRVVSSGKSIWWGTASGLTGIAVIALLLSTAFARITITVSPHTEQVVIEDIEILLDASVSEIRADIRAAPAERLEFRHTATRDFEATGKQLVEEKARGRVRIYNRFSSSPQGLVAATRFLTENGVLYRLVSGIIVPGAKIEAGQIAPQFVEAELMADKPGEEANQEGELTLNIPGFKGGPKYEGFYAVASGGFSGGFKGEARVVSKDDVARAEEEVSKAAFDKVREDMRKKIPPDLRLVEALREIEARDVVSPRPGTRRDNFSVEASAVGKALVFREDDIKALLSRLILVDDKSRTIISDSFALGYRAKTLDLQSGRAEVIVNGEAISKIVINREELLRLAAGKKEGSLIETLKGRKDLAAFNVAFFPPWLFSAPEDPQKIRVILEGEK